MTNSEQAESKKLEKDIRYLTLLAKSFPTIASAST